MVRLIIFLFLVSSILISLTMSANTNNYNGGGESHSGNPINPITREKRYIGWGRRPGMRYSKASSVFDLDNTFNKIYNKWEKRAQPGPEESPVISNFRELRMKQKIPNAQVLLPHLFNRNNREEAGNNGDEGPQQDENLEDLLMILAEEYNKGKNNGGEA